MCALGPAKNVTAAHMMVLIYLFFWLCHVFVCIKRQLLLLRRPCTQANLDAWTAFARAGGQQCRTRGSPGSKVDFVGIEQAMLRQCRRCQLSAPFPAQRQVDSSIIEALKATSRLPLTRRWLSHRMRSTTLREARSRSEGWQRSGAAVVVVGLLQRRPRAKVRGNRVNVTARIN